MRSIRLSLFADYFQFYLQDEAATGDLLSESWTDEAVARMLAVGTGTVGIGTVRNMDVPVLVEVHDNEPPLEVEVWDHVVEASLEVTSGRIVVAGCTEYFPHAARIDIEPGFYRVRVAYGALDTLSEDGLMGADHYMVQVWASPEGGLCVLKRRSAKAAPSVP